MTRWATRLHPTRPAVLNPGRGDAWWWVKGPVIATEQHLWWISGSSARQVELQGVVQVLAEPGGLAVLLDDDRVAHVGRDRVDVSRQQAFWISEGFVYRRIRGRTACVAVASPGVRWSAGPSGALLGGGDLLTLGSAPDRTPQALPEPLLPGSARWSPDGTRVAGLSPAGGGAVIDLVSRRVVAREDGVPVAADTWLRPDGAVVRHGRVLRRGVLEASSALSGTLLAGPGGVVWDLETGRRCFEQPRIRLGVTVATPSGFVTIDWETHRGYTVAPSGEVRQAFVLPVDPDDTVVGGGWHDDTVHVETALGERFRIRGGRVEPSTDAVPSPAPVTETVVGTHRFTWTDDGWLLAYSEASKVR